MTIIRRTTTAATGPNVNLLPQFINGAGIPGVTHRWLASQIPGNTGDVIATWAPYVGTIGMKQNTVSKRPTLRVESGVRMVRTDAASAQTLIMDTAPVEANVKTIVIVARAYTNPTTATGIVGLGGGSSKYNADATPKNVYAFWTGATSKKRQVNASLDGPNFHTVSYVGDRVGGVFDLNVDAAASTQTDAGVGPFQGNGQLEVGQYAGATFGSLDILEIIAWSTALTPAQHLSVRTAMQQAYPGIIT